MPDLRDTRKKLKIIIVSLAVIDALIIAILFSPLIGSERSRREQLSSQWRELQQKTREVEPLRGLDKKIPLAQQQIDDFYKSRLTSQDSTISAALGKLASENGVKISSLKYSQKEPQDKNGERLELNAEAVGLRRVQIDADLSGNYLQLVRFINAMERDRLFFIVNSVALGGEQEGSVKLQMKLETYLKASG
ncbi:MAG: hypothetical protein JOY93_11130 [Acidobacteriales bacterium]|nr:hypothetical protein [Terriglobales bacterium]